MSQRFVSIWFRHLKTDWFSLRQPQLRNVPFVLRTSSHGRMIITATNAMAELKGISKGMVLADARAIMPELEVLDDVPELPEKLLNRFAEWCIRYSPIVSAHHPDGVILDVSGCPHLWGGDELYVRDITERIRAIGFDVRVSMADTIGAAWAVARYGNEPLVIPKGKHFEALLPLPPDALRIDQKSIERLHKLGLHQIKQFIHIPRHSLRRRFGQEMLDQLDKALGQQIESITPLIPIETYEERLPCLEPISTAKGIEIAIEELLKKLCLRLSKDQKGLRNAIFKCYRLDGKVCKIEIGTNRPTHHVLHLIKLFELKIQEIEPGLGIELFTLTAGKVEEYLPNQEKMWADSGGLHDERLGELIDRIAGRIGNENIQRYLPREHYWPERSFGAATSLDEEPLITWDESKQRPVYLLSIPEPIEVTAPIPDYPPMLFRYKGKVYNIARADGPERIEQEWWIQQGQHRDYYRVEDTGGHRYWIFRLGHYDDHRNQWFLHGFFS